MSEVIVSGIAAWAHITKPSGDRIVKDSRGRDLKFESQYKIDLILTPEEANRLNKEGYNIKKVTKEIPGIENSIGLPFLHIKAGELFPDGNVAPKPVCVDSSTNPYTGLIGNGSKVNISFTPIPYDAFGGGISCRLKGAQVVELVEHKEEGGGGSGFTTVPGFVAEKEEVAPVASASFAEVLESKPIELDF